MEQITTDLAFTSTGRYPAVVATTCANLVFPNPSKIEMEQHIDNIVNRKNKMVEIAGDLTWWTTKQQHFVLGKLAFLVAVGFVANF